MRSFHAWTRDLHLYLGLFLCPVILVFALSTLWLNHPALRAQPAVAASSAPGPPVPINMPDGAGTVEQARNILRQLNVTGEIDYVRHQANEGRLFIPVSKPGEITKVEVDLRGRTATVQHQEQGLAEALIYLHKMPGPHNVKIRGNWVYTVWWSVLADAVVYGVFFLTLSGLYLWWMLKAERQVGWLLLGAGILSTSVLVIALCTA
jgi:hypothetical protein